ncbi:hypothetical protein MI149_30035 (plasmid) [Mycolicibacterium crocinum]|uniref:TrbL/VirB6 plasmid conjugal transfer protein n=1 Tax=Mycolicibacterium crocinum TaxID=388459 RepID=A0ABY3U072_9MYCO|nr:hypothetical protein [Mycolicibacterium crocinum]ULN44736.1 hypothetical protein MI149_30035 [Mycolicibacterium crocinum]
MTAAVLPARPLRDVAAERLGYELALHPRLRRVLIFVLATHTLALWALITAPRATAATMAAALNWTGITDTYAVPIGAYFLSTVDTMEALTEGGPDVSVVDPGSWVKWGTHALTTGLTHETVASWVQAQASCYIFLMAAVLWLLKFAMSSTWMTWLATWFKPILEALRQLLVELHVFPICLALGIGVGAFHILWHGRRGHGAAIILSAFAIGMLGLWLTRDPLGELTGNDGLINQARTLGFSVAQAATNNGPIAGGGATGQLNHLTSVLADALLRAPLQIWNFGTTVDSIGSCGNAWSSAIMSGVRDAPAHAMSSCGAPQALHYAQSIDGSVFALGLGFCFLGLVFAVFVTYVTYSYIMVCGAALLNAVMAIFAVGPAMIHGAPRRGARRRLEQFFRHAFLVFVYVLYTCVAALLILKTVAPGGLASQVGMTSPVAMLVLVALWSAVATGVFWWLKKEILHDHTRQDLVHTVRQVIHLGKSGYQRGQDKLTHGRDLADKARERFSRSPGTDDDSASGTTFTQPPVPGRPPAGRTRVGGAGRRPGGPTAPPTTAMGQRSTASASATRAGAGTAPSASGAAGAAEAGAAVLAPEVAIPAAIAVGAASKVRGGGGHRQSSTPAHSPSANRGRERAAAPAPAPAVPSARQSGLPSSAKPTSGPATGDPAGSPARPTRPMPPQEAPQPVPGRNRS